MNKPDNTPLIQFADTQQTMTSIEIAEVTGKQHKNVLQAIRKMEPAWEKVTGLKFQLCMKISELANGVKKENPYYVLTKTETLYIATKFNDEARARLVLRWEQLEHECRQPAQTEPAVMMTGHPAAKSSRRQLLVMLIEAEDENIHTRQTLDRVWMYSKALMQDIDNLQERVRQLESRLTLLPEPAAAKAATYTATQLAGEYGMKAIGFNNLLQQLGIQHNTGGCWAITPDYAGRGYTLTKQISVHDEGRPRRKPFMVWTEQGRRFIHDTLSNKGIQPTGKKGGES